MSDENGRRAMADELRIVFDGPPSHESGRFVEVEDAHGRSVRAGEWVERDDGLWELRIRQSSNRYDCHGCGDEGVSPRCGCGESLTEVEVPRGS